LWNSPYRFPNAINASLGRAVRALQLSIVKDAKIAERRDGHSSETTEEDRMSAVRSKNLNQWVAAAQSLVVNSTKKVDCPDCQQPALQVRDVEYGWGHNKGLERYLVCSNCGAFNAVNMRHARPFAATANDGASASAEA
jgi:hypothetical protein